MAKVRTQAPRWPPHLPSHLASVLSRHPPCSPRTHQGGPGWPPCPFFECLSSAVHMGFSLSHLSVLFSGIFPVRLCPNPSLMSHLPQHFPSSHAAFSAPSWPPAAHPDLHGPVFFSICHSPRLKRRSFVFAFPPAYVPQGTEQHLPHPRFFVQICWMSNYIIKVIYKYIGGRQLSIWEFWKRCLLIL